MAKPGRYSKKQLKDWFIRKELDRECKECGGLRVLVLSNSYCNDCGHEIDYLANIYK